jgi:GNAT superfamily N-acetyltransferase
MELRLYLDSDREQVIRLHEALARQADAGVNRGSDGDSWPDIELTCLAEGAEFWVGEENGVVAATGAICIKNPAVGEIKRLGVQPELQRRGHGGRLLSKLEERGRELGYRIVCAETSEHLSSAQQLFASRGYEVFDRQTKGGVSTVMYGKWITDPPPEPTPEETAKFEADWEVHNRVQDFTKQLFQEGCTPEQAMERVLESDLFAEWRAEQRSFLVGYDEIELYRDLEASVRIEAHIDRIEERAAAYFDCLPDTAPASDGSEEADPVFIYLHVRVTPTQLAYELASFSRKLGLSKPVPYNALLGLMNGTYFNIDPDDLERMNGQRERAGEWMQAFVNAYRDGSAAVRDDGGRTGGEEGERNDERPVGGSAGSGGDGGAGGPDGSDPQPGGQPGRG